MAGNYHFLMDQKDIVLLLVTTVDSFTQERLINRDQRAQHKEQCAERLAAEGENGDGGTEVRYSDQAVLANLDWGIDALEEAINTSNTETKLARLDYAEKMLQVCAMLNSEQKTAGVPNFYLSAWANLNLSYLWKLREDVENSVLHVLEMFIVDPFFSRIDFAPELWRDLFLPQMSSIVGWYSEARHRLVMEAIPDSSDLSFTADLDQLLNESVIFSVRPDQIEKLHKLEGIYRQSLDENTRLFAKFYKDCMKSDSTGACKKVVPMMPIAEPPRTPLHEVSRSIPDYVKFGPILPKSAGFSVIASKDSARQDSRLTRVTSNTSQDLEEPIVQEPHNGSDVEKENDSDDGEEIMGTQVQPSMEKVRVETPKVLSSSSSPKSKTSSPKVSSPKPGKRESMPLVRLLSGRLRDNSASNSLPTSPHTFSDYRNSADSDGEAISLRRTRRANSSQSWRMSYERANTWASQNSENDEEDSSCISFPESEKLTSGSKPPKDFVCPITGQIFSDPVTLETGQTYERKAIQEWLERGNTSCPITRQALSASTLPKMNYVLKRLITSWSEQHPDLAREFSYCETPRSSFTPPSSKENTITSNVSSSLLLHQKKLPNHRTSRFAAGAASTSPTSVISQATVEAIINGLKPYISCLCTSENLQECEEAVLAIAKTWKDTKGDPALHSHLCRATVVNGLVEILSASLDRDVLRASIYLLSELISVDESIGETLTSVDSDFDCLAALLKNGLFEAIVLINQLRPSFTQLSANDFVPSLVQSILNNYECSDDFKLLVEPKDAALAMLEQILMGGDEGERTVNTLNLISADAISGLIKCMDKVEQRQSVISILLCCIQADKSCRNLIATRIEVSSVLELFHVGDDTARGICINFLSELVHLDRRTVCNQILQIIKDEGAFSTMHTLLVYLQMAPMEQQPTIAALLLQLDLLVEPRKMSIYREEAVDALIEALQKKDFPNSQIMAIKALLHLSGRLTASGNHCTEAWLLKVAGFEQPYNALVRAEKWIEHENKSAEKLEEEEKASATWERRVAFVLCNHEKGSIFKALEECLKSNSIEIAKSCLVVGTWLIYMLSLLPDTGVRDVARKSLLDEFINILQSSKNLEEKILASLALKTFISDPAALEGLGFYAKRIYRNLRKLKRHSVLVTDILKALMRSTSINAAELWSYNEVVELESGTNGEVLALVHFKTRLLSSHSDGTIKMWDTSKRSLRLIQEVREHAKAVTCLCLPSLGDRLFYSGSLDKTIRVWALKPEEIHCVQVHDVKEPVHGLTANSNVACFISQGTGIKVYNWSGSPKHVNFNKTAKCLAMFGDKLYCGCSGYSVQEVDLGKLVSSPFYSGTRKLLGKQTIHALHVNDNFLFCGGSSVDGTAGKVFSFPSKAVVGAFSTGFEIQHIAASNDFIFTATKCGIIEVWLRERISRLASIKMACGGHHKITSLASDIDGGMLFAGSSDGRIQAWALD
ncbi:putative E3 ubiquitin-protein ligase LIN-1 isoform X2 [Punica granatum]|uniref:RING-type E3 ubiquitin transferase n=1 Tax=Punica granatum TaxID=22663 RepID=A0A6P8EQN9_PUNGR|nr:putative E3 ubiquitin-protein ligase LIN-1 isoform X2 [Punica granatum]